MHPDFSAAKIEKKSAQITRANTVFVIGFNVDAFLSILRLAALSQKTPRLVTLSATFSFNTNLANSLHRDMSNSSDFLLVLRSNAGYGLLIHEVSRSHTTTHQSQ